MPTCRKCKFSPKRGVSLSWQENLCPTCWGNLPLNEIKPEETNQEVYAIQKVRMSSVPTDFYLDTYTFQEMERMN